MSVKLEVGQSIIWLGTSFPPSLCESTITKIVENVFNIGGDGSVDQPPPRLVTVRHVHLSDEPDGADNFDERFIWPDTPECRAHVEHVCKEIADPEIFYASPAYRRGEEPAVLTAGQQRWCDLQLRMAAFRVALTP